MASIKKRRGTYSVVYSYENDKGEKKQRWETFKTYAEAHKRRAEIEYKKNDGTFLPPNKQTVKDVLEDYILLYGEKNVVVFYLQLKLCADFQLYFAAHRAKGNEGNQSKRS